MVEADGETVMLDPVPTAVPPHEPEYHFHVASEPKLPPLTVSVTLEPAETEDDDAEAEVGAVLEVATLKIRVAVLSQPAAFVRLAV